MSKGLSGIHSYESSFPYRCVVVEKILNIIFSVLFKKKWVTQVTYNIWFHYFFCSYQSRFKQLFTIFILQPCFRIDVIENELCKLWFIVESKFKSAQISFQLLFFKTLIKWYVGLVSYFYYYVFDTTVIRLKHFVDFNMYNGR